MQTNTVFVHTEKVKEGHNIFEAHFHCTDKKQWKHY